jgi:signal transduction histidine kinase
VAEVSSVLMNEGRLQQLFIDLVRLFIDRSETGTTVTITLDEAPWKLEQWITLIISTPRLIFKREELQSMLDSHLPRVQDEDALRLSIDRRIVDEHGGSLLLVNRPDEEKSFVSLRLPPFRKR